MKALGLRLVDNEDYQWFFESLTEISLSETHMSKEPSKKVLVSV